MAKTVFGGEHQQLVAVLVAARQAAGLRQVDLAELIGRDQSFVSLIESGQRRIDTIEFFKLAKALGRDPRELFGIVAEAIGDRIDPKVS